MDMIDFLGNRIFKVRFGSSISQKTAVMFGLPHGGSVVLGTVQYIHFDTNAVEPSILSHSRNRNLSVRHLERAINPLKLCMGNWVIRNNPERSQIIHISRKSTLSYIRPKVGNVELDWQKTAKSLRVRFDGKFTWNLYLHQTVDKAGIRRIQLYSYSNRNSKLSTKLILCKTCLLPVLEYKNNNKQSDVERDPVENHKSNCESLFVYTQSANQTR